MNRRSLIAALVGVVVIAGAPALIAAGRDPEDPMKPLAFLEGTWLQTEEDGSIREEIWSSVRGPSIIGCFRWTLPNGAPRMLEILAINREKDDAIRLYLRHFSSELAPVGAEDKPLVFKLVESKKDIARFEAEGESNVKEVKYAVIDGALKVTISFSPKDGKTREPLLFDMKKQ
ncbi:MAG: DUF6265 family protein [Phycisphaerales bacterium]